MLTLSQRERDRLAVLKQVADGLVSAARGAELVGLTPRQFRRVRRRYEAQGDGAVIHGLRDRRSNRALSEELHDRVLERAREPVFADFGPTLLAEHLSSDPDIGELGSHTLRRWMIEEGLWKPKRRGARHRKARPRRAALGELIQWDSSEHKWFEDRVDGRQVLIQMHDDATNRLMMARFVPRDNGSANRQIAIDYLRRWGRPVAFYTDKAGHFGRKTRPGPRSDIPLEERDPKHTTSIIRAALRELNIELILAHSPQAKGRVERNFGTSQDRLVKEMRVRGISTLAEANTYLEDVYVPMWNSRFAVEPAERRNRHRKLSKRADLERLFAKTLTRSIGNDFTIQYQGRRLQISKRQSRGIRPRHKLTIEIRLDGSTRYRWKNRYLDLEVVARTTKKPKSSAPKTKRTFTPPRPGPDHPWRKNNVLVASPKAIERYRRTMAASQPSPSTPSE
jgi:hypothetical protein